MFDSSIKHVGELTFPKFSGLRIMMMPFKLEDLDTIPDSMEQYRTLAAILRELAPVQTGTAYLTIDEAIVKKGETHRRPGIHVDGIGPDGREAAWGGGGGYASGGMLLAASVTGCIGWDQPVEGYPGLNGDCTHLSDFLDPRCAIALKAGRVYHCSPLAVHEARPMHRDTRRQFIRLSMPNDCPWYEGYTVNPNVKPTGPIHPKREAFMAYRPG